MIGIIYQWEVRLINTLLNKVYMIYYSIRTNSKDPVNHIVEHNFSNDKRENFLLQISQNKSFIN